MGKEVARFSKATNTIRTQLQQRRHPPRTRQAGKTTDVHSMQRSQSSQQWVMTIAITVPREKTGVFARKDDRAGDD